MIREDIMSMIKLELEGLYGADVLQDINATLKLYKAYEEGVDWEESQENLDYTPTKKKTNIIKQLIKDEARFLFGKTPDIKLTADNKEVVSEMQNYINATLKKNLFSSKLIKAAKDCFIGKRVALKLNATEGGRIKIMFLPSMCFVYDTIDDDVDELRKIIFFYVLHDCMDKDEQRLWRQKYELVNGQCILNEAIYNGYGEIVEVHYENYNTGLDFIPAYVIINDGLSGDLKGESDVQELLDNQLEYNKLSSEDIDTLRKGMNQIIYGMDVEPDAIKHFRIKPGAFWDVPTDPAKAEKGKQAVLDTISNDFGYDTRMENTLKRLESEMYSSLKIPNVTPDELKGFITSGKSMKALYWQLIARCQEKFMDWQPALEWMVHAILEMTRVYKIESFPEVNDLVITVENQFPLPEDEAEEKAVDLSEVSNQTMSRKRYIEKWTPLDEAQVEEELKQIALEAQMLESSYISGMNEVDDTGSEGGGDEEE